MILAQSGESYPINRNGVDATVNKSVDDIMSYVTALGYNSFLLVNATYTFANEFYVILPFDATLVNGDSIYLLDNPTGVSEDPTTGAKADRVRNNKYNVNNDGNIQQGGSISWSTGTYYGDTYRTYPYNTYEPVFYTTLEYAHIYVNNEDVTPVLYTWSSVPAISGKNGILSLPLLDSVSWDGTPITDADISIFTRIPDMANIKNLYDNIVYGEETPIVYAGDEHCATITWINSTTFSINYYWNYPSPLAFATLTYTLAHAQDEVWFAFASMIVTDPEDPEFEEIRWGRPTFIIRDAESGKYSFGIEQVTEAYYPAFYEWHIAGFSADFSIFGEPNEEEGGDGYGDLVDEGIDNPLVPTIGAIATGFTKLYYITGAHKSKLSDLMDWFNDEDLQFVNQLFKGDPMQALIGVNLSPLPIEATGAPNIHFLGIDTGIASDGVVTDQFQEIDCGSINIDWWMKNTYLDFAPYTSIKAVLPYVGCIDLNVDDLKYKTDKSGKRIMSPATLSLKYVIDALTGACVAHLFVNGSLHYEASGNCFIPIPLTQKDYAGEVNAIRQAVASVSDSLVKGAGLAAMGVGGAGAVGAGIAGSAIAAGINVAVQHPNIKYIGGNTGAVTGYMGFDRPFLLIEQPVLARPAKDEHYTGMPSYITGTIGSFLSSGNTEPQFARFNDVHLENIDCTEQERNDILEMLHNGVMLDTGSGTPDVSIATPGNTVIVLLHNKSERNVIGKTFASNRLKIESNKFFNQSILSPVFIVPATEVYTYNYAYVPILHRYYYITDMIALENNMIEIHMQVDPLQSFKDQIKACKAICARSEWRNNFLVNDGAMLVKQPQQVSTIQFKKNKEKFSFTRGSAGFIIVVASGATI